ncbi:MAG: 30S ribosomal protein S20 [Pseudomonadota bacterium]|nr:30S ribosomal protein S20 [Pseudomonadota bacterium]
MANTAQAKKRARQAEKHRQHNASLRSQFRTQLKKIIKAIEGQSQAEAKTAYQTALPVIDSMVNKGIIHCNKAARHKSRLNSRIRAMSS